MSCEQCVTGTVHVGTPTGKETKIASLPVYTTGDESSERVIVVGVDIFGWKFVNTRLLADEYASHGFRVLIPDLFDGAELPQWTLSSRDPVNETPSLFQRLLRPFALGVLVPFVIKNTPKQTERITGLVKAIRAERPEAKIGFVGFCWGGRYSITLNELFEATVAAHPSLVKYPAELDLVKKPISFAVAETDHNYDRARGEDSVKRLKEKGVENVELVVYEGVQHGWTIRGDLNDPKKKKARDDALHQTVNWFQKYL